MENDTITTLETPLLATPDDAFAPSLSADVPDESEFSRLIARTNPLQALAQRFDPAASSPADRQRDSAALSNINGVPRGSWIVIWAGTLSLLHLGFIWGSYMSDVWTETHATVSVAWQEQYLPMLDGLKDSLVRSTSLMSVLQDLYDSKNYILMSLLWIVSLIFPCTFMILSPSWILTDYKFPVNVESRMGRLCKGRSLLEILMRFSYSVLYVFVIVDLSSSFVEFQWTDTSVLIRNRAVGGLACYAFAITCAVGTIMILRSPPSGQSAATGDGAQSSSPRGPGPGESIRSPPPQAFRFPWRPQSDENAENVSMSVLEEPPCSPSRPLNIDTSGPSTPELIDEDASRNAADRPPLASFWHKVLVYQVGLLVVAMWIPTLHFPVVRFEYSGLATDVMISSSGTVYLWQIPSIYWTQGIEAGTSAGILLIICTILVLSLLVFPMTATCLGILAWIGDGEWGRKSRQWLYCVHAPSSGIVFVSSLVMTIQAIKPLSSFFIDESSFCEKFANIVGEHCLSLSIHLPPGAWFYVAHSILFETFVFFTLRWSLL